MNHIRPAVSPATAAELLRLLMRDLSEDLYCAGWLHDLEYHLWRAIDADSADDPDWPIEAGWRQALKELSAVCNGWWHWDGSAGGERFLPLSEWKHIYLKTRAQTS